jgi:hypothetical protein
VYNIRYARNDHISNSKDLENIMKNLLLILCVHVLVCNASKGHGRSILLILCVRVSFFFSVSPCGSVSCLKRPC